MFVFLCFSPAVCRAGAGNALDCGQIVSLESTVNGLSALVTVETWFKGSDPHYLFTLFRGNFYFRVEFGTYDRVRISDLHSGVPVSASVALPPSLADNQWHHLAAVWSWNTLTLYLDGQYAGHTTYGSNIYFPDYDLNLQMYPTGIVDEFRIWSTARSQAEIQQHMDRTLSGSEDNLVLYYDFDHDSGTVVTDRSGNGYHGIINTLPGNPPYWMPSGLILDLPQVTTLAAQDVGAFSALVGGEVTYDGGDPITSRGVCWDTEPNPDLLDNVIEDVSPGLGSYTVDMLFLDPETTYYVRAFAINANGTSLGDQVSFATAVETVPDPPGYALVFDGDDYVGLGDRSGLNFSGTAAFTVEAWVKPGEADATGTLFARFDQGVAEQYYLGLENGVAVFHRADGATAPLSGTTLLEQGHWYHLACTFDGTFMRLYVDGTEEASQASGSVNDVSTRVLIGARRSSGAVSNGFIGALDEVRVWNTALDESAIQAGMTAVLTGGEANLTTWYAFDKTIEGSGKNVPSGTSSYYDGLTHGDLMTAFSGALGVPNVNTLGVPATSTNFAAVTGQVVQEGASPVIDWGVCYNTTGRPLYNDDRETGGERDPQTGTFETMIKQLDPGVTYFARAYAVSGEGIGYGGEFSFTTAMTPPGNALSFDNDTEGVYTPGVAVAGEAAFTVEYWLQASHVGTGMYFTHPSATIGVGYEDATHARGHYIFHGGGTTALPMDGILGFDATDGGWHHIAVTFTSDDPSGFRSYFDGTLVATRSTVGITDMAAPVETFLLMGNSLQSGDYLAGGMDEIRVWTQAKSAREIRRGMNRTFYGNEENLLLYYRCDHTGGTLLEDASGNGHNGIPGGQAPTGSPGTPGWMSSGAPLGAPHVETELINPNPFHTARFSGTVVDDNDGAVTARGICWNTGGMPTVENDTVIQAPEGEEDSFTLEIPDLVPGRTYCVRTFARNAAGAGYGNQVVFRAAMPGEGKALSFDGVDDAVKIRDPFSAPPGAFTIALWVKPDTITSSDQGIVGWRRGGPPRKPTMYLSSVNGGLHYDTYDGTGATRFHQNLEHFFTAANEWVHVAWIKDGTEFRIYRNGELFATVPAPETVWADPASDYWIGVPELPFAGDIDEVAFYSRALTVEEVLLGMHTRLTGTEEGLEAYYTFNQVDTPILLDSGPNANHGSLMNGPSWVTSGLSITLGVDTVWVDDDYCEFGANEGRTYGRNAFKALKPALAAVMSGGTVIVKDGLYKGAANRTLGGVDLSLTIRSENGPERTVFDAEKEDGLFALFNSDVTIEGLTLLNSLGPAITSSDGNLVVRDCIFIQNRGVNGGAIQVAGISGTVSPLISKCTFIENEAEEGGAVFAAENVDLSVTNSLFMGNRSTNGGGGALAAKPVQGPGATIAVGVTHCTFQNNDSATGGDALLCAANAANGESATVTVTNSILWGSDDPVQAAGDGVVTATYSAIQGGFAGTGNISDDPLFAFPKDPHIKDGSPCIDTGTNTPPGGLPATDLYGNDRMISTAADMGAYEVQGGVPMIALSEQIFRFMAWENGSDPEDQGMWLKNGGDGTLNFTITSEAPWLILVPDSGAASGSSFWVNLHVDSDQLAFGYHTTFVEVAGGEAGNSPRKVPVIVNIRKPLVVDPADPAVFATIQDAIDAALDGETVTVKDGVYTGAGNKALTFGGKTITVRSERGPENTIIDCENDGRGIAFSGDETPDVVFEGFTIRNGQDDFGGGIFIGEHASPTIRNCIVENCTADWNGGGIMVNNYASPAFMDLVVRNNTAHHGGGIYYSGRNGLSLANALIVKNNARLGQGGGIYLGMLAEVELTNVTIADNDAYAGAGALHCLLLSQVTLVNSIVWGNGADAIHTVGTVVATYCDIEGGYTGLENIDADPQFVDPAGGVYFLEPQSACINAGNNSAAALPLRDLLGKNRILDSRVDLGPYEMGYAEYPTYMVDDIPDHSFVPGYSVDFTIASDRWGTGENLSIAYDHTVAWGNPAGNLTLDPNTGQFRYIPPDTGGGVSTDDWRPFALTFTATANDDTVSQTAVFQSGLTLPPEKVLVQSNLPVPDPADRDYIVRNETWEEIPPGQAYNWQVGTDEQPLEVATIDISGKTLVIASGHSNNIYDGTHGRPVLKAVNLYAETVIVRDPWHLPRAHVTIYARDLVFEDDGVIVTTGLDPPEKATDAEYYYNTDSEHGCTVISDGSGGHTYENGEPVYMYDDPKLGDDQIVCLNPNDPERPIESTLDHQPAAEGLDAPAGGSVTLHLANLDTGYDGSGDAPVRFELTGGRGQDAGNGLPGLHGNSLTPVPNAVNLEISVCDVSTVNCGYSTYWADTSGFNNGTLYIRYCDCGSFPQTETWLGLENKDKWPQNGTGAITSSIPGFGGRGGDLLATLSADTNGNALSGFLQNPGGAAGAKGADWYGGERGYPGLAYKYDFIQDFTGVMTSHVSYSGAGAMAPEAAAGADGTLAAPADGHAHSWVHPFALTATLAHARDVYLNDNPQQSRDLLAEYPAVIDAFLEAEPDSEHADALVRLRDEILALLYRIGTGLDYYGNPPGWTPMLSFEITRIAYKNEVDHALRALYLNRWIKKAQEEAVVAVDALEEAKSLLEEETVQLKQDYADSNTRLGELEFQSWAISNEIERLREELKAHRRSLVITTGIVTAGTEMALTKGTELLASVPAIGGALSGGLSTALSIGGSVPLLLDVVGQLYQGFSEHILQSDYPTKAADLQDILDEPSMNLNTLMERSARIAEGLQATVDLLNGSEKDPDAIISALNKLRNSYPILSGTISDTIDLLEQKTDYAAEMTETLDKIATIPNQIIQKQLTVLQMEQYLSETGNVLLEQEDLVHLAEMERRARERLIRYHYYMARAYAYRMLKPYPEPHNLTYLLDDIIELVDADVQAYTDTPGHEPQYKLELTSQNYLDLKALFENKLWEVADQTLQEYMTARGGGELSTSVNYGLSPSEIEALNEHGTVTINLVDRGFFPSDKEDIRLVDIEVDHFSPADPDHDYGNFASVEILARHSGLSRLMHEGQTYLFQHHSEFGSGAEASKIIWGATYDFYASTPDDEIINPITPSHASTSLLFSMLDANGEADHIMIYSRPAAWADLVITAASNTDSGEDIEIAALDLKITYDYGTRSDGTKLTLQVEGDAILPHFLLDAEDVTGRRDGFGDLVRVFDGALGSVGLEAQQRYGPYAFVKWTDRQGNPPAGIGDPTSSAVSVPLNTDLTLKAVYIADADDDGMEDAWETEKFGDTEVSDGTGDADGDGLSDLEEFRLGADPLNADTDGDGMPDGWEAANNLDPLEGDAMANPDGDAAPNIAEYQARSDPHDPNDIPDLDSVLEDFESGDLSRFGWTASGDDTWAVSSRFPLNGAFSARTPLISHSQSARLAAGVLCEAGNIVFTYKTSSEDCAGFLCDGLKFYIDGVLVEYFAGITQGTATYAVEAGQHTFVWEYVKDSEDGFMGGVEDRAWVDDIWFPADLDALDTDKDGMPDSYEMGHSLNPFLDDAGEDADGDGFSNLLEYQHGTSPSDAGDFPDTPGDVNHDGEVNLTDAILALQVLAGLAPEGVYVGADLNNDGKIDLVEVIYILREIVF